MTKTRKDYLENRHREKRSYESIFVGLLRYARNEVIRSFRMTKARKALERIRYVIPD